MFAADGVSVAVTKGGDNDPEYTPWIAIPAELARAALDRVKVVA